MHAVTSLTAVDQKRSDLSGNLNVQRLNKQITASHKMHDSQ